MRARKNKWLILLIASFLVFGCTLAATAVETRSGDMVNVAAGNLTGPLFISGNNLTVNANIEGDVFAAGSSITINGNVNGDVIAAGNTISVNGPVSGDIRIAGNTIDIGSTVGGSITAAGNTIFLREPSNVYRDVMLFGNTINMHGIVKGQALGSGNQIYLQGPIGGNVQIWDVQSLNIGPSAAITGSLTYRSANAAQIDPAAKISSISQLPPIAKPQPNVPVPRAVAHGIAWTAVLISVIAGFIIWGAFYLIFPRLLPRVGQVAYGSFLPKLGWGFLTLLVAPLAVLVLLITVIGIPLAFIVLFLYILILCLAKVLVSDYIVRFLAQRNNWAGKGNVIAAFIVTLLLLAVAAKIPMVGFFISLIIASVAFGLVVTAIARWRQPVA